MQLKFVPLDRRTAEEAVWRTGAEGDRSFRPTTSSSTTEVWMLGFQQEEAGVTGPTPATPATFAEQPKRGPSQPDRLSGTQARST